MECLLLTKSFALKYYCFLSLGLNNIMSVLHLVLSLVPKINPGSSICCFRDKILVLGAVHVLLYKIVYVC